MLSAFAGDRGGSVDARHVVVENGSGGGGVGHVHVLDAIVNVKEPLDAFICCQYFCLARALRCFILTEEFPGDRSIRTADYETGEGLEFE